MYSTKLEFLGLASFFVINVMYSALVGIDLSTFISQIISGKIEGSRWIVIVLFLAIIISLILNFVASVFTAMTLGNLYSEFESKGIPIMLSSEYRTELNTIKGLFLSSIVFITLLTLRIFISPNQMAHNMMTIFEYIPADFSRMAHFILCLVVFGLTITMYSLITTKKLNSASKDVAPDFPEKFKSYFTGLSYTLFGIVLLYILPVIILPFLRDTNNTIYETAMNITKTAQLPIFYVMYILLTIAIFIFSILWLVSSNGRSDTLSYMGIAYSVVMFLVFLVWGLLNVMGFNINDTISVGEIGFKIVFLIQLFIILYTLGIGAGGIATYFTIPGSSVILLTLFMVGIVWTLINIARWLFEYIKGNSKDGPNISEWWFNIPIAVVDTFYLMKNMMLFIAIVLSTLTIYEYTNLPKNTQKFTMYNNKFKFNALFISLMVFLMLVLFTSLVNSNNLPLLLVMMIEYISPVILVIMSTLLIYYTNHLAKLSKKHVISDVAKTKSYINERRNAGYNEPGKNTLGITKIDAGSFANQLKSTIGNAINTGTNNVKNEINSQISTADANIQKGISEADRNIQKGISTADANIQKGISEADRNIQRGVSTADANIQKGISTADANIQKGVSEADRNITNSVSKVENSVNI